MRRTLVWRALLKMGSTADIICTFYCGEKLTWHSKATQRHVLVFRPQTEFLNKTKIHFRHLEPTRQHQILVSTPVGWIKPTSAHLRCGHILQISLDEKSAWGKCFLLKEGVTQKWKFAHPQVVPNLYEVLLFWTQDILIKVITKHLMVTLTFCPY